MREFTPEEKELITNTPITIDCFEKWNDYHYEQIRKEEHYFDILIHILPGSYKVVKL